MARRVETNKNLGFLSGVSEKKGGVAASSATATNQSRRGGTTQQQRPQTAQLNTAPKATMMVTKGTQRSHPVYVQPGEMNQSADFQKMTQSPDVMEKLNRWRAKRNKQLASSSSSSSSPPQLQDPNVVSIPASQRLNSTARSVTTNGVNPPTGVTPPSHFVPYDSLSSEDTIPVQTVETDEHVDSNNDDNNNMSSLPVFEPKAQSIPTVADRPKLEQLKVASQREPLPRPLDPASRPGRKSIADIAADSRASSIVQQPLVMQSHPLIMESHPLIMQSQPQSLFDPTSRDLLKSIVEIEVKKTLDQLRKDRPELASQEDVMNMVNQKTRKVEESVQQFNVREQRLQETINQIIVSLKAVQSNIDNVKTESGGAGLTEDVMRSWVSHFFNEQIGMVKKDFQTENRAAHDRHATTSNQIVVVMDQVAALSNQLTAVNDKFERSANLAEKLKGMESNLNVMDSKFQNTLQNIFETGCFVFGTVVEDLNVYAKPNQNSDVLDRISSGVRLLLLYPIVKDGNDRWMKVRIVDSDSAALTEGWVHVFLNDTVFVNSFGF